MGKIKYPAHVAITVICFPTAIMILQQKWINAFIKLPAMRLPFEIFYIAILVAFTFVYISRYRNSIVVDACCGLFVGQVAGVIALVISNLFIANGIARTFESMHKFGAIDILWGDCVVAFILGGWLTVCLQFIICARLMKHFPTRKQN